MEGHAAIGEGRSEIRANNSWDVNWGNSPFPLGIAVSGGANIPIPLAGTYEVTFNDITGDYSFTAVSYAAPQKESMGKDFTGRPKRGGNIFPPEARVQEIFSNGEDFLEGPVMSPEGLLYFSDFSEQTRTGVIWTLDPQTRAYKVFRSQVAWPMDWHLTQTVTLLFASRQVVVAEE
jgi:hypothetical protein